MATDFEIRLALAKAIFGEDYVETRNVPDAFENRLIVLIKVKYSEKHNDWNLFRPDFDYEQAMRLEQWLVKDYVIYYTPRQSDDWRVSFQKAPAGKHRWSYFDIKHDNTQYALIKARYEAAKIIIRQQLEKAIAVVCTFKLPNYIEDVENGFAKRYNKTTVIKTTSNYPLGKNHMSDMHVIEWTTFIRMIAAKWDLSYADRSVMFTDYPVSQEVDRV